MSTSRSELAESRSELADINSIEDRRLQSEARAAERHDRIVVLAMRIALIALILLLWEGAIRLGWAQELLIGQPSRIGQFLAETFSGGELLQDTFVTGMETMAGYSFGIVLGACTGLLMWWLPRLGRTVDPYLTAVNAIPMVALAPLFLVWFGLGIATKIALSFKTVFLIVHLSTYAGLRQVQPDLLNLATAFGATRWQIFRKIVIPSTLPWIMSAMKLSIGFALTGAVIGEYVAANKGLGYLTLRAAQLYEMSLVWAAIVMLVGLSLILYSIVALLQARFVSWSE